MQHTPEQPQAHRRTRDGTSASLRREIDRQRRILDHAVDGILTCDAQGRILRCNASVERLFGYPAAELIGQPVEILVPRAWRVAHTGWRTAYQRAPTPRPMGASEVSGRRRDGSVIPLDISLSPFRDDDQDVVVAVIRDLRERRQAEAVRARLDAIVENSPNGIVIFQRDGTITYANTAARVMHTGDAGGDLRGADLAALVGAAGWRRLRREAIPGAARHGVWLGESTVRTPAGELPVWQSVLAHRDRDGGIEHYSTILTDISEQKAHEERLRHQASHDQLTGLANRALLEDRLAQAIRRARRRGRQVAVLFIDLDNFKLVNDTLGHAAGDQLLTTVAERLSAAVRREDTVARQGGDEFVVLLEDVRHASDAAGVAGKLAERLSLPMHLHGDELTVTPSIGISVFPEDGTSPEALLMHADAAMFRAKQDGRNTCRFYTGDMNEQASTRLTLENDLRRALSGEQLHLLYQPVCGGDGRACDAFEALLRWSHPARGELAAADFLPLAEESGQIAAIGAWTLAQACRQARDWGRNGLLLDRVSVNVSPGQLRADGFLAGVDRALEESGLAPRQLELELTENALIGFPAHCRAVVDALHERGIALCLDNFGSGYTSLTHLKLFRFGRVKIDPSFVRDLVDDPDSANVARAVIAMAHALGARVVAQGVETDAQMRRLREFGCDEFQGRLLSPPLPPGVIPGLGRPA
ncbi:MAG TPA: EAL domain-containing protein [Gammaproteobacteria bacterium]|nr:EAL domain-containing protein [Gammaproteobacteria bacterium]